MSTVHIVGAGPGDPDLMTVKADRLVRTADVVAYDRLVPPEIPARAPASARRLCVGKRPSDGSESRITQAEINALLVTEARRGREVVRLKGGDPFVFGRGGEEALALRRAGIGFQVVPGVTSATAAPGAAAVPVTDRRFASAFTVVTAHRLDVDRVHDWAEIAGSGTLVVLMGLRALPELTSGLVKGGLEPQTSAVVVASATRENQRIVRGRISTIARRARDLEPPATVIVGSVADLGLELSKAHTPLESLVAA